jgi:tripartite-type tricarboxylate transporter receptor subunit TctC
MADITPANFDLISRLALIPAGVTVKADSPFKSLQEMLDAVKDKPKDTYSASGSGQGGPWHMAIAGLEKSAGLGTDRIQWIPSKGGAPALQDLVAGGITFFTGSPIEAKTLLAEGEVRQLAIMSEERSPAFPDVPTVKEAVGIEWALSNWFSLVAPKGLDPKVKAKIVAAAEKAHASAEVQEALAKRGITPLWDGPDKFKSFADEFTGTAADLLRDLGLAK